MRVILLQDLEKLGKKNEVKEVSDGYARNFLLPRNLAKMATPDALRQLTLQKAQEEREKSEEYQKYRAGAEKARTLILDFSVRVGAKGRAFGSVSAVKIRDAMKKQGVEVEKDWIILENPLKETGDYIVKIKFPHGIMADIKIHVRPEKSVAL